MINEANKYIMPAVEDYLGARCLLLNNVFVGLVLAHETMEKLLKAVLLLESINIPKSCHKLTILSTLLTTRNSAKYKILSDNSEFIERLDLHYGWRYWDGDPMNRSRERSSQDLYPLDQLWVGVYKIYMEFIPSDARFRTYFLSYLFNEDLNEYVSWGMILKQQNKAIEKDLGQWQLEWNKIFKH